MRCCKSGCWRIALRHRVSLVTECLLGASRLEIAMMGPEASGRGQLEDCWLQTSYANTHWVRRGAAQLDTCSARRVPARLKVCLLSFAAGQACSRGRSSS